MRPSTTLHPGAGRRGQGPGLPTARRDRHPAVALVVPGLAREVVVRRIAGSISASTVRRWLREDTLRPSAKRVFWIVDNGSSHRGKAAVDRLAKAFPNAVMVHTPVHASWTNQIEIFFSVVQRKVVASNDFTDLGQIRDQLRAFEDRCNATARPFQWKFTTSDLDDLLTRLDRHTLDRQEESSAAPAT
ncbi:transposase [Streptomyces sp. NBC_01544]|uniref:transposase n=1 Tax=unclassified Streptomyces TaxID=2593676 RepID=UPI0038663937